MDRRTRSLWRLASAVVLLACGPGVAGAFGGFAPAARAAVQDAAQEAGAPARVQSDRWYEIWMGGGRAGWSHESVTSDEETITTTTVMQMKIGRADEAVEIRMRSEFVETLAGEPVEVRTEQRLGPTPLRATYRFGEDGVTVVQDRDGKEQETRIPSPEGEWLPPAAAGRYVAQRLASGAKEITVRTVDPSNGLAASTITRSGIAPGETEVAGERTECLVATTRTVVGATPMSGREWFLRDGTVLRTEMAIGGLTMVSVASSRELALESFEPPELMVSTFVRPDRPIETPRTTDVAVFRLRVSEGELPELPESGFQRVEVLEDGSARVRVDSRATTSTGVLGDDARGVFLASTTYADTGDEMIRTLSDRALDGAGDAPGERAEALRRFVYTHIGRKDLGTAFATASEVARSGRGDCTEHGVLLAAMLRAAGIPSRVAVGVVYVERFAGERDVFGYHMWTQAHLETEDGPAWVDLDATLDRRTPFDATHIALATSDLAEGQTISQLAGVAPMLGTLEIVVEEASRKGGR
ncbi:MAG: transglutaminase family protein [Phycisphaerales bacterium JB041]